MTIVTRSIARPVPFPTSTQRARPDPIVDPNPDLDLDPDLDLNSPVGRPKCKTLPSSLNMLTSSTPVTG